MKVRYQLGLVNLAAAPLLEIPVDEDVITKKSAWSQYIDGLMPAAFRDRAAGWVADGFAAPFVRILEVRDATPEEVAAALAAANV